MRGLERRNAGTRRQEKRGVALKDKRINIRVTDQEERMIKSKARYLGISVSRLLVMGVLDVNGLNFSRKKEFMSRLHQLRLKAHRAENGASIKILRQEVYELCQLLNLLMADAVD